MVRQSGVAAQSGGKPTGTAAHAGLGMVVVMTGVLITAVDTTIVVLALPEIERDLHVPLASVIWVMIGYLLVITVLATRGAAGGHVRPGTDVRGRFPHLRAGLPGACA